MTTTAIDRHGNTVALEGCDRCGCGAKYWEADTCVSCGAPHPKAPLAQVRKALVDLSGQASRLLAALDEAMEEIEDAEGMIPNRGAILDALSKALVETNCAHAAIGVASALTQP